MGSFYFLMQHTFSEGIRSIINLQTPFEHASCGQELHEMGFSYDPKQFMDENGKHNLVMHTSI